MFVAFLKLHCVAAHQYVKDNVNLNVAGIKKVAVQHRTLMSLL